MYTRCLSQSDGSEPGNFCWIISNWSISPLL